MRANRLSNFLQEEILEQLPFLLSQERLLHLDAVTQNLQQFGWIALVFIQEKHTILIV